MPSVSDTLERAEVHIQTYQEATAETPAAPQKRFSTMLASLRAGLTLHWKWSLPASTQYETGIDMLARKYPDVLIQALCG